MIEFPSFCRSYLGAHFRCILPASISSFHKPSWRLLVAGLILLNCLTAPVEARAVKSLSAKQSSTGDGADSKKSSEKRSRRAHSNRDDKKLDIPIFYLTDRDEDSKSNYGSKRRYIVDCKHDMYYGQAHVILRDRENKYGEKFSTSLNWKEAGKENIDQVSCKRLKNSEPTPAKGAFFKELEAALAASGGDRICLFVHGADESFNDAALDAAALAYELEYPLILYSWPSVPKTLGYVVDGGNNEWSQAHFNTFIRDLLEFRKDHKIRLIIVSHSMGNRLIVRAAHLLERSGLVRNAELVSPDIDAETFKHYILGMENQGAIIRLYTSSRDKMLPLSQMVYGGYYRLGEGVGEVFGALGKNQKDDDTQPNTPDDGKQKIDNKSSSANDDTGTATSDKSADLASADNSESKEKATDKSRSSMKESSKSESDDKEKRIDESTPAKSGEFLPHHKRGLVERVDFTDIDTGISGHSIPFKMLASMIREDIPGPGLKLASATPSKGSKLARFMSWSHHLGKINDEADSDLCKRIVRVDQEDSPKKKRRTKKP